MESGRWRVERREGSAEQHFAGFVDGKKEAHEVITAWAFNLGPPSAEPVWAKFDSG